MFLHHKHKFDWPFHGPDSHICMLFWSFQNYSIEADSYQLSQCCRKVFCFVTRYSIIQSGKSIIFCVRTCVQCLRTAERSCWSFVNLNMTWKIQCQCNLTSNLHLNEFAIVRLYSRQKLQCIVMLIKPQWVFLEDYTYLSNELLLQECEFDPLYLYHPNGW